MGKSAPSPPSPKETASAQTGTSVSTAIANAMLGNVGTNSPYGTTSFDQSGSYAFKDPFTGQSYDIPTFTETSTLSPTQQQAFDAQQQAQINLSELAQSQSGFLQDYMSQPVDLSNEATEARLFELGSKRLDPRFAREEEAMRSNLISRGIREGTDAFSSAMGDFGQSRNDAYNQLLLQGRGQATQEALTERNQPINEITALLSGGQVSMPQFTGQQQPTIPTTDTAGLINQNYQQQLANWQQQNQFGQNIMGGLFGLGSAGIMASDDDVKKDKTRLGDVGDEMGLWTYHYKNDDSRSPLRLGLMASEVEKEVPDAVIDIGGVRHVDYPMALGAM